MSKSSSSSSFTSFSEKQEEDTLTLSQDLSPDLTQSTAPTGDLNGPVRPVVLQVRFIQVLQDVVLWIVVVLGFVYEDKQTQSENNKHRVRDWGHQSSRVWEDLEGEAVPDPRDS